MKNIDTKRMTNLMNWDIMTYRKEYINMLLATFGYTLATALVCSGYFTSYGTDFHVTSWFINDLTTVAILIIMFAMLVVAGLAFQHMMSNQERIAYLMLPASTMEKYLVRVVFRSFLMFGLTIAGIVCADLAFALLVYVRTGEFVNIIHLSQFFGFILSTDNWSTDNWSLGRWLSSVQGVFLIWSFFVLGSAFFRRKAILKTFLCLLAGAFVFSAIIGTSIGFMVAWLEDNNYEIEFLLSDEWFEIIANMIVFCWLSFNLWYSYRLFSRMQVINNRWNNK